MSNMLRAYRRSIVRRSAEAKGLRIFGRGSGRAITDDHSRLSAAMHIAAGTKGRKKPIPKRGTDAKRPTAAAATPKRGITETLLSAIRRRLAQ